MRRFDIIPMEYFLLQINKQFQQLQSSKKMSQLNQNFISHLKSTISMDCIQAFITKYQQQQQNQSKKINTPATNYTNTSWRKEGNAINKLKRKRKIDQENIIEKESRMKETQLENKIDEEPNQEENYNYNSNHQNNNSQLNKAQQSCLKILRKNKAIYFGEQCQLPYLHSSDTINSLYSSNNAINSLYSSNNAINSLYSSNNAINNNTINSNTIQFQQPTEYPFLFNPSPSIEKQHLTSLKSLHIYHSNVQCLRILGTGWHNIKELTISYSNLCSISGLSSFCNLQYLFIPFNKISILTELMFHPKILCIDLQRNNITNLEEVQYLYTMDKLQSINLEHNPILQHKPSKRIIYQKFNHKIDPQYYSKWQIQQQQRIHHQQQIQQYSHMEISNHILRCCHQQIKNDFITNQALFAYYSQKQINYIGNLKEVSEPNGKSSELVDFLTYKKYQAEDQQQQQQQQQQWQSFENIDHIFTEEQNISHLHEEFIVTPLIHFVNPKKYYTNTFQKYLQNKLYIQVKNRPEPKIVDLTTNSNQKSQAFKLGKISLSTKLQKGQNGNGSLDKKDIVSSQLCSLDKIKKNRLSLGKNRKFLQRFEKQTTPITNTQQNFTNNLTSVSPSKTFTFKRGFLKKNTMDIQSEMANKFIKHSHVKCQE